VNLVFAVEHSSEHPRRAIGTTFILHDVFTAPGRLNARLKPSISQGSVGGPKPQQSINKLDHGKRKSMGRRAKNKQPPPGPLPDATNRPEKRPVKRKAEKELERSHKKPKQEKNVQAKPVKRAQLPATKQKEPSHKGKAKEPTPEESDEDGWGGIADMPALDTSKKYVHAVFAYC